MMIMGDIKNINGNNMLAISKVNISIHYQYHIATPRDTESGAETRRTDRPTVRGGGQNTDFLH